VYVHQYNEINVQWNCNRTTANWHYTNAIYQNPLCSAS
jgi:hypothetical protein